MYRSRPKPVRMTAGRAKGTGTGLYDTTSSEYVMPQTMAETREGLMDTSSIMRKFRQPSEPSPFSAIAPATPIDKVKEDLDYVVKDLKKHGYLHPSNLQLLDTPDTQRQIARLVDRIASGKLTLENNYSSKDLLTKKKTTPAASRGGTSGNDKPTKADSSGTEAKRTTAAAAADGEVDHDGETQSQKSDSKPKDYVKYNKRQASKSGVGTGTGNGILKTNTKTKLQPGVDNKNTKVSFRTTNRVAVGAGGKIGTRGGTKKPKPKSKQRKRKGKLAGATEAVDADDGASAETTKDTDSVSQGGDTILEETSVTTTATQGAQDEYKTTIQRVKSPVAREGTKKSAALEMGSDNGGTRGTGMDNTNDDTTTIVSSSKPARTKKNDNGKADQKSTKPNHGQSKPKKSKRKKDPEVADYVRFLKRDPTVKLLKNRSLKSPPAGLTPSDFGVSFQPNATSTAGAAAAALAAALRPQTSPDPDALKTSARLDFSALIGTDKQKLDKAETIVGNVSVIPDSIVDFASMYELDDPKNQDSLTLLQKLGVGLIAATRSLKEKKVKKELFRAEVKLPGILNENISLEFAGDALIIIAYRPKTKKHNARKITEIVEIPSHVNINSLRFGRRPNGSIWIEEWNNYDPEEQLKREIDLYLSEQYAKNPDSITAAIEQDLKERQEQGSFTITNNNNEYSPSTF